MDVGDESAAESGRVDYPRVINSSERPVEIKGQARRKIQGPGDQKEGHLCAFWEPAPSIQQAAEVEIQLNFASAGGAPITW